MSANEQRPDHRCPKCGSEQGFTHVKAEYHDGQTPHRWDVDEYWHTRTEHLDWSCEFCGYRIETPTADQVVA